MAIGGYGVATRLNRWNTPGVVVHRYAPSSAITIELFSFECASIDHETIEHGMMLVSSFHTAKALAQVQSIYLDNG